MLADMWATMYEHNGQASVVLAIVLVTILGMVTINALTNDRGNTDGDE